MRIRGARSVWRGDVDTGEWAGVEGPMEESFRGVIRADWNVLLVRCGVAYGLMDPESAAYLCGLRSEEYRLGEYVGEYVEVCGPIVRISRGIPIMEVVRLRVIRQRWMG